MDPSSLDSSMDGEQRRQPGSGCQRNAASLPPQEKPSLWPLIMAWARGRGVFPAELEPGQRKGNGWGAPGPSWGCWGLARWCVRGVTYVHILLLRTSGCPRCSHSRDPGGGHRQQPPCSCPRAAEHTSYSIRSRL